MQRSSIQKLDLGIPGLDYERSHKIHKAPPRTQSDLLKKKKDNIEYYFLSLSPS